MKKQELVEEIYKELMARRLRNADILMHIPDEELRIIKGHILIEEVLFELIKIKMSKPKVIENARLSFSQALTIVEGMYFQEELQIPWLYRATEKLNRLRNKFAHNIDPKNIREDIDAFMDYVIKNNASKGNFPKDKLLYSLGSLHINFASILAMEKKLALLPKQFSSMSFPVRVSLTKLMAKGVLDDFA